MKWAGHTTIEVGPARLKTENQYLSDYAWGCCELGWVCWFRTIHEPGMYRRTVAGPTLDDLEARTAWLLREWVRGRWDARWVAEAGR